MFAPIPWDASGTLLVLTAVSVAFGYAVGLTARLGEARDAETAGLLADKHGVPWHVAREWVRSRAIPGPYQE